jgi:small subunit ribosomal protein S12e
MVEALVQTDFQTTLKKAVQSSLHEGELAKGLHEVCKALEGREAKKPLFLILAENCDEQQYVKLVTALAKQNEVPILKIAEAETLGEWIGLAKVDAEGKVRKPRKCSSVVIRKFSPEVKAEEQKLI